MENKIATLQISVQKNVNQPQKMSWSSLELYFASEMFRLRTTESSVARSP